MLKPVGDRLSVGVSPEVLPILFVNDLSSLPTVNQALSTTATAPLFSIEFAHNLLNKKTPLTILFGSFKLSVVVSLLLHTDTYIFPFQLLSIVLHSQESSADKSEVIWDKLT